MQRAEWALHLPLFRRYRERHDANPSEEELRAFELQVIDEARDWDLDWHPAGGRLSAIELLASMQHFEAPTRFLDFTFNPLVALWFAVQTDDDIGRVFAIDTSGRNLGWSHVRLPTPWWYQWGPWIRD